MITRYLLYLLVISLISSCTNVRYYNKKHIVIEETYLNDTVHLNDFVLCKKIAGPFGVSPNWPILIDDDTLYKSFLASLFKLDLKLKVIHHGKNQCDNDFQRRWKSDRSVARITKIQSIERDSNTLQLVPIIYFEHQYHSSQYVTSSGMAGGEGYKKRNILTIQIYILNNSSIIYMRSVQASTETYYDYDKEKIVDNSTQLLWDEMVALVMKDYLDRLQDGTEMNKLD